MLLKEELKMSFDPSCPYITLSGICGIKLRDLNEGDTGDARCDFDYHKNCVLYQVENEKIKIMEEERMNVDDISNLWED
jgi:hypothetical protein